MISITGLAPGRDEAHRPQPALRLLQGETWARIATVQRIEAALAEADDAEARALAAEMVVFTRGSLSAVLALLRVAIEVAEAAQRSNDLNVKLAHEIAVAHLTVDQLPCGSASSCRPRRLNS